MAQDASIINLESIHKNANVSEGECKNLSRSLLSHNIVIRVQNVSSPKVWLVTGASSGIGLAVTQHVLSKGDKVAATVRKPHALSDLASKYPSHLLIITLDVTKAEDIPSVFSAAQEKFGRIDIVYNNAGAFSFLSEAEGTPIDDAKALFEVNFWGASNVTREAIQFFRDVNKPTGGRLIQASSGSGITGYPLISYYCASKFALEGFTEAVSKELDPSWNIKITSLALGGFKTPLVFEKLSILPPQPAIKTVGNPSREFFKTIFSEHFGDSLKAAREIYNIANDDSVLPRVFVGADSVSGAPEKAKDYIQQAEKSAVWNVDLK